MCFLVAKLIRRNLFYSSEKVLKLTLSNVEMKKNSGSNNLGPLLQYVGDRGTGGEGRGWEGRHMM